jgi:hypothetical protein
MLVAWVAAGIAGLMCSILVARVLVRMRQDLVHLRKHRVHGLTLGQRVKLLDLINETDPEHLSDALQGHPEYAELVHMLRVRRTSTRPESAEQAHRTATA